MPGARGGRAALPRLAVAIAVALGTGCQPEPLPEEAFLALAPRLVQDAVALERARGLPERAPLLLDVASFAGNAVRATGRVLPVARVDSALRARLPWRYRPTPHDSSYACLETPLGPACYVPDDGLYVRLVLMEREGEDRWAATVLTSRTRTDVVPPQLCDRRYRFTYRRMDGDWRPVARQVVRDC